MTDAEDLAAVLDDPSHFDLEGTNETLTNPLRAKVGDGSVPPPPHFLGRR